MRIAVLSDIHSNWEALQAVDHFLEKRPVQKIWILGDTIGYGAGPNECLEWVLQKAEIIIRGNHEEAVVRPSILEYFSEDAACALKWTSEVLHADLKEKIPDFPFLRVADEATLAHGSPDEPEAFRYLFNAEEARPSFRAFGTRLCFVGHTHFPALFSESSDRVLYPPPGPLELAAGEKFILNPGSVGQPRDPDKRLSFGIFDNEENIFDWIRLEYDNEKAASKIRRAGLPAFLADRLL